MKNAIILTLTLCLALGTVAQAAITDGLLGAHDFNDLVDDSGNGHNAGQDKKDRDL